MLPTSAMSGHFLFGGDCVSVFQTDCAARRCVPDNARALRLTTTDFTMTHCRTVEQAKAAVAAIVSEATDSSRRTWTRWVGFEGVWTSRGRVHAVATSSGFSAAVLPLCYFSGVLPAEWSDLLQSRSIVKACGSDIPLANSVSAVGAHLDHTHDIADLALETATAPPPSNLSDILFNVQMTIVPEELALRQLCWRGPLSDTQAGLLALHAYGAFRVAEELSAPCHPMEPGSVSRLSFF